MIKRHFRMSVIVILTACFGLGACAELGFEDDAASGVGFKSEALLK